MVSERVMHRSWKKSMSNMVEIALKKLMQLKMTLVKLMTMERRRGILLATDHLPTGKEQPRTLNKEIMTPI